MKWSDMFNHAQTTRNFRGAIAGSIIRVTLIYTLAVSDHGAAQSRGLIGPKFLRRRAIQLYSGFSSGWRFIR